jgi:hypothetical protein
MGIVEVTGLLFIALKLLGVISWGWFWVTMPLWGGLAITILVVIPIMLKIGRM